MGVNAKGFTTSGVGEAFCSAKHSSGAIEVCSTLVVADVAVAVVVVVAAIVVVVVAAVVVARSSSRRRRIRITYIAF